jgi:transglutaminase-like putative cysteine protease
VRARPVALLVASLALAGSSYARVNVPAWVREAIPATIPVEKDADAIVLLDDTVVSVQPDGSLATRLRRVVKILNNDGRGYGVARAWIDHDTKLRTLKAWSIDAGGGEYEVRERDAIETTPTDFELYTDARLKVLSIPASNPGSVVAYEIEFTDVPYLPQVQWQFQEDAPVLLARFDLQLPAGWTYEAHWMHHEAVAPTGTTWTLQSVPSLFDEPNRPSAAAIAGGVGIQLLRPGAKALTWNDIGKWFGSLAMTQSAPTPLLQAKTHELADRNQADAMRAIARFTQRDVRYVAVEIGIGGFQPHAAGEVFSNRFGDCKDKANLLRTMLRENSVESYHVLVNTSRGVIDPKYPTLGFNHVISAIHVTPEQAKVLPAVIDHPKLGKLLLFDPTSTLTPFGLLPESLQASRGLLVTPEGGELIELPVLPPETSQLRRTAKLMIDGQGTLSGSVEEVHSGTVAVSMRAALQPLHEAERVQMIESRLASHMAALTAADVTIEHLDDPESDLVIRYKLNAPQYARRAADLFIVRPRVIGAKADRLLDAKRVYAYETDGPSLHTDEVEIRIPASMKLDELPAKVDIKTPVVQYNSASTFADGVLHYRRRYALQTFSVQRESFAELNGAWKQILGDERASAVFK